LRENSIATAPHLALIKLSSSSARLI